MEFVLICFIIGLIVLYPPVRKLIFQGVWAMIVGAAVIGLLLFILVMLTGATPIMPDDCAFTPQAVFCEPWVDRD